MNKADVISSLQQSGEATYDTARETLKSVSVDASGKVELEDYVEVRSFFYLFLDHAMNQILMPMHQLPLFDLARVKTAFAEDSRCPGDQGWQGHG